ncbi:hypothetical protein GCM10008983_28210 [Lentibacillus halophilus]|uniref:WD40-like Beta Propeller Repeat n=1 Tax=Lentibacillus halophilus TaxID=295065 RepID=A0ABN0ZI40_9BACI
MRKIFLFFCVLVLSACSSDESGAENRNQEGEGESAVNDGDAEDFPEPETIFTYEYNEDDDYEFRNIESATDASTVLFSTEEKIKREETRTHYIKYGDNDPVDLKELSEADEEELKDRRCRETEVSPDGQYVTFSCADDDNWFVVYDTEAEEIVHREEEPDPFHSLSLLGISDDMDVFMSDTLENKELIIKDLKSDDTEEFDIPELVGEENALFNSIHPADSGSKFFLEGPYGLFMLDTESKEAKEIMDVSPYEDRFEGDTDEIHITNVHVSPNGQYAFFLMSDSSGHDDVYRSFNFVDVESGDVTAYTDPDYKWGHNPVDNEGNVALKDGENLFLYNIGKDKTRHIPNMEPGVRTDRITLSGDGNTLLYEDQIDDASDGKKAYELYELAIDDLSDYEEVAFDAEKENTEELLSEAGAGASDNDGFDLHPVKEDASELIEQEWEASADVPFPSIFPEKVDSIISYFSLDSHSQTILMDSDELSSRNELEFEANDYTGDENQDICIADDLELEKTEDGIEYYFYLFSNDEAELAFVDDGWCYALKGDGITKDEMFDVIDSMETQGKQPEEFLLDEVGFPAELPMQNPEIGRIYSSDSFYVLGYGSDQDDIAIEVKVDNGSEPDFFDDDDTESVELDIDMEGYYYDDIDKPRLFMYDGDYYYTIIAKIDSDEIKARGGRDKLKETLIEVGNSVE